MIDIEKCKKLFNEYIKQFDFNHEKIHLKYGHTLRVLDFCEKIAKSLNLNEYDIELAKLIGLLHDIGRFEQIKIYDTYNDNISVNHALLGVQILETNDYINNYVIDDDSKKIVIAAITNHNKFKIPNNLNPRTEMFCKIIRDADKLDIINLIVKGQLEIKINSGVISSEVLNSILNEEEVKNKDIESKVDDYVSKVALIFDFNFDFSLTYINERNVISDLIDNIIQKNNHEKDKLLAIKVTTSEYVKKRLEDVKC